MTKTAFTNYLNDVRVSFESAKTVIELKHLMGMYCKDEHGNITPKQYDAISAIYQTALAKLTAQKKGDKQMSNKNEETKNTQPEVVKGEVIDTKNEKVINDTIGRVSKKIESIGKGYIAIIGDVARLRDLKAWKVTGNKNIYELCNDKFGMARGTVHNLLSIFERYGDKETYKLTDECSEMSIREMLANIASENKAAIEDKNGTTEDGEASADAGKGKSKKVETLVNISFDLASDDWTAESILDEIKKQLEEAATEFPSGATVTFTLTK